MLSQEMKNIFATVVSDDYTAKKKDMVVSCNDVYIMNKLFKTNDCFTNLGVTCFCNSFIVLRGSDMFL